MKGSYDKDRSNPAIPKIWEFLDFRLISEDKVSEEGTTNLKRFWKLLHNYVSNVQQILKADWIINNLYLKIIYHHVAEIT